MAGRRRNGAQQLPELVIDGLRALWPWRLELALLATAAGVQRLVTALLGDVAGVLVVVAVSAAVLAIVPVRRALWRLLRRGWLRRAWTRAASDTGLADGP